MFTEYVEIQKECVIEAESEQDAIDSIESGTEAIDFEKIEVIDQETTNCSVDVIEVI